MQVRRDSQGRACRDRAPVGDAQEVGVVGVGERLRRPGLVSRHPHAVDRLLEAEAAGERADHRQSTRARSPAPPAAPPRPPDWPGADRRRRSHRRRDLRPRAGGRAPEQASHRRRGRSPRTAAACSPRRPGGDPLGLAEQVARLEPREPTGGGEGKGRTPTPHPPQTSTSSASTSSSSASATRVSESCSPLIANTYSRNSPCRVTLNRASDGKNALDPAGPDGSNNGAMSSWNRLSAM